MSNTIISLQRAAATPEKHIMGLLLLRANLVRRHNRLVYRRADPKALAFSADCIGDVVRRLALYGID